MKNICIIGSLLFLLSCSQKMYQQEEVINPEYRKNTAFVSYEDISLPKFNSLKEKYKLDTIFHGEKDEFKRMLLLRHWIRQVISINDFSESYPGKGYPEGILDAALNGHGFHCGHYMVVQNAAMNAYGYVTRCLGSGPGVKGVADGHHGINEIWINKYHKWFLSDAKYDHHFEKNGIPLSVLEIRDEYIKNKAADIVLVKGPNRTPIEFDGVADIKGEIIKVSRAGFAQWYTWLEWFKSNDRFTVWPDYNSKLIMYQDEYFKNHTWIWDGKPHYAYKNANLVQYVDSKEAIEWTPNTIQSKVTIEQNKAKIILTSSTPNLKEYQMNNVSDNRWEQCDSVISIPLSKKRYELIFRTVNLENVCGSENKVIIVLK